MVQETRVGKEALSRTEKERRASRFSQDYDGKT